MTAKRLPLKVLGWTRSWHGIPRYDSPSGRHFVERVGPGRWQLYACGSRPRRRGNLQPLEVAIRSAAKTFPGKSRAGRADRRQAAGQHAVIVGVSGGHKKK